MERTTQISMTFFLMGSMSVCLISGVLVAVSRAAEATVANSDQLICPAKTIQAENMDLCEMERYYGGFAEGALPYNPGQRKLKLVLSPNFGKTSGVEYFKVFDDGTHLWIVLDILHIMQLGRFESDLEKLTPGNLDTALIPKTSLDSIAELFIKNNDVFLLNENYFAWTPDQMFRTNISEEARLGSIRIGHPYYWHPIINRKINKRLENLILTYNAITASQAYLKWMDKNFNPRKDWYDYNKVIAVVKGPEWVAKNAKRRGEIVRETSYMIVKGTEPENDEPPKNCKSRRHWKDRTCVHDRDGSWITVTEAVLEQYNATSDDPAYANFSRVPALLSLQEGGWDELVLRTFRKINFRVGGSTISEVVHVDIRHIDNEVDETEVDDIETWNVRPSTRRGGSSEVEDGDANVCLHASNEKSVSWGSYGEGTPGAHFPVNYGKVSLPAKERERGAQVPGQCGKEQPTGLVTVWRNLLEAVVRIFKKACANGACQMFMEQVIMIYVKACTKAWWRKLLLQVGIKISLRICTQETRNRLLHLALAFRIAHLPKRRRMIFMSHLFWNASNRRLKIVQTAIFVCNLILSSEINEHLSRPSGIGNCVNWSLSGRPNKNYIYSGVYSNPQTRIPRAKSILLLPN